jgi:hypothetical protein
MEIKLITKETNLNEVKLHPYNWDAVCYKNTVFLDVYKIEGYYHCIGGKYGNNDLWCCPRNEKPTFDNLAEFNGNACNWDFEIKQENYTKSKWNETEVLCTNLVIIRRNGKRFYSFSCRDLEYGAHKAMVLITDIQEHPISFSHINYENEILNRKIYWKHMPSIIRSYSMDGNLGIVPDEDLITPEEFSKKVLGDFDGNMVMEDLFAPSIDWFREVDYY